MSATATGVPDLLRRFAPAPYHAQVLIAGVDLEMHTNDVEIVAKMQRQPVTVKEAAPRKPIRATIIRDIEAPVGGNIAIIAATPLTTLLIGTGTVVVLDSELREILGFLAPSISAADFIDNLLPLLLKALSWPNAAQQTAEHR